MLKRLAGSFVALLAAGSAAAQGSDSISIVSPVENYVARPGEVLPVVVKIDESLDARRVAIWASFSPGDLEDSVVPSPYETKLEIPQSFYGTAALYVLVTAHQDDFLPVATKIILFRVEPDSRVSRVVAPDDSMYLYLSTSLGSSRRLPVYAVLATGQTVSAERAGIDVKFSIDDPSVATVSPEGTVSAVAPGRTWLIVEHENSRDWVEVTVNNEVTQIGPPAVDDTVNVAITSAGFTLDPENNQVTEEIIIANTSQRPLHRPYYLVIDGLPEGVVLLSPAGRTRRIAPLGTPFELVTLVDDQAAHFMPGTVARTRVQYLNPRKLSISHKLRVITGAQP